MSSSSFQSIPTEEMEIFVAEWSLYRVAKNLRLLGYDCVCAQSLTHAQILQLAALEGRTVITGSRKLIPMLDKLRREVEEQIVEAKMKELEEAKREDVSNDEEVKKDASHAKAPNDGKRRVIIGYNSDGESEYETEDDIEIPELGFDVAAQLAREAKAAGSPISALPQACGGAATMHPIKYVVVRSGDAYQNSLETVIRSCRIVFDPTKIFTRCVMGNQLISDCDRESVKHRVHESVYRVYKSFYKCPCCDKVYWGMDGGVLKNYKTMRTVQHLQNLCASRGALDVGGQQPATTWGGGHGVGSTAFIQRHMFAYPRQIKCLILSYLPHSDIDSFAGAFPMLVELVDIVKTGKSFKFVSEARRKRMEARAAAAAAAEQEANTLQS